MSSRICICCGEPIARRAHLLSGNPNICGACFWMVNQIDESAGDSASSVTREYAQPTRIACQGDREQTKQLIYKPGPASQDSESSTVPGHDPVGVRTWLGE